MKILLIDDDELVLETVGKILTFDRHIVFSANGHEKAFEIWKDKKNEIDLIISDIIMPMNGIELVERLKKTRSNVPVLFMSGYPADYLKNKGISYNDINFISKPFTMAQIKNKLKEVEHG